MTGERLGTVDSSPRFSVIVPTHGRPEFLGSALQSIYDQTLQNFEILVVDDGSVVPVDVPSEPRLRVIRRPNGGAAAARNTGAEAARGRVLTFLDDDDLWRPDRLELAEQGLARAPVAICGQREKPGRRLDGWVHDVIAETTTPHVGATAIERAAWVPMNETYRACEDVDWWLRVTRRCRVATVPRQGLVYRHHAGPRTGYGDRARVECSHRLLRDHAEYFASHPRARAYRLQRIGMLEARMEHRAAARHALMSSLMARPTTSAVAQLAKLTLSRS